MIKLFKDSREIEVKSFKFPAGESYVAIQDEHMNISSSCVIKADITSGDDIMELLMLTDAVKRFWRGIEIKLLMPYVPYGRHDRVMVGGESFGLKVFCDLINTQGYSEVIVYDPHSDVTGALLDNLAILPQEMFVDEVPLHVEGTALVAPDAGALKKVFNVAKKCGFENVICAGKVRDVATGVITAVSFPSHQIQRGTRTFLIVDDICDGGRTFLELAKKIKENYDMPVHLYITHGIFSKGFKELREYIDHIYVVNCFLPDLIEAKDFVTIIEPRRKM